MGPCALRAWGTLMCPLGQAFQGDIQLPPCGSTQSSYLCYSHSVCLAFTSAHFCPGVTLTVPPVKAASLTSTFNEANPSSSSHCLHAAHMAPPQPHSLQNLTQPHRKVEASFVDSGALWDLPHLSQPQKGTFYGELSSGSSGYPSSQKLTGKMKWEHYDEQRVL